MNYKLKKIPGFPNYSASTNGDIFNKKGEKLKPYVKPNAKSRLNPDKPPKNYHSVKLYSKELPKGRNYDVHTIIAKTFLVKPENARIVDHINGQPSDNRLENLEWVTDSESIKRAWRTGLQTPFCRKVIGYKNGVEIGRFNSIKEASKETGVPNYNISKVCRGVLKQTKGTTWEYNDTKDEEMAISKSEVKSWINIKEFPKYRVSKDGQIYNESTKKLMRLQLTGDYKTVKLSKKGKKARSRKISILTATAYIPNPDNLPCVDHISNNKLDDSIKNLEWVTAQENSIRACKTGACPPPKGVSVVQLNEAGEDIATFNSLKEAAAATGAHPDTITLVCKGKRKHSGGWKWRYT